MTTLNPHVTEAERDELRATFDLRPMDTAPRDGTLILVFRFYYWIAIRWTEEGLEFPWEGVHLGGALIFMQNNWQADDEYMMGWMPMPD